MHTHYVLQTIAQRQVTFTRRDGSIGTDIQTVEGAAYDALNHYLVAAAVVDSVDQNAAFVEFAKHLQYGDSAIDMHNAWRNMMEPNGFDVSFYLRRAQA